MWADKLLQSYWSKCKQTIKPFRLPVNSNRCHCLITSMIGAAHSPDSWDLSVTLKRNAHRWLHNLFPFGSPLCVKCEAYSERDRRSEPENYSWSSLTLYVSLGHSLPARSQSQLMVSQHWLAALFFIYIYILHTHNTVYEYASLGTSISKRMYCL